MTTTPHGPLAPVVLEGPLVRLEPLAPEHFAPLTEVALSDRSIWTFIPYRMESADDVAKVLGLGLELERRGAAIVHVTRLRDGTICGSTSIRSVDPAVPSVEIGGTWLAPRWQRSGVNRAAKRLQLAHCFEVLGCERVELKTDVRNERSRTAMTRLGAKLEGEFRAHMRRGDGTLRDSAWFSILRGEWPAIRARLDDAPQRTNAR